MVRRLLLWNFRIFHRLDRWLKKRLTTAGLTVFAVMGAGGVFGVDLRSTVSYQLFALMASILLVSWGSTWFFAGRFSAHRALPRYATVATPLIYTVRLENRTSRAQTGLLFSETLEERLPSYREFLSALEPSKRRRNVFDRHVGYPLWAWLIRHNRGADTDVVIVPPIGGDSAANLEVSLTPFRRGIVKLSKIRISRPDPFGLVKAVREIDEPDSILVLPKTYPVSWHALSGRRPLQQKDGKSAANALGDSDEFATVREYRPGDPLRRIHWPSWAKFGQPIVKEFQDESYTRNALVLDNLSPDVPAQVFEEAVSVAASFLDEASSRTTSRIDLMFMTDHAQMLSAGGGIARTDRLLESLAVVRNGPGDFETLSGFVLRNAEDVSACVLVLLEWDEKRKHLVKQLGRLGIDTVVLLLSQYTVSDLGPMSEQPDRFHVIPPDNVAAALAALTASKGATA